MNIYVSKVEIRERQQLAGGGLPPVTLSSLLPVRSFLKTGFKWHCELNKVDGI